MKRIVAIIMMVTIISACDIPRNVHSFVNVYYDNIYERDFGYYTYPVNDVSSSERYVTKLEYDDVPIDTAFLNESRFELSKKGGFLRQFVYTGFYQNKNLKCYLFKYTLDELIDMKKKSGISDAIFLIERRGIRVVSRSEYEKLKPTFKPHPYDPSLCNTNPNE